MGNDQDKSDEQEDKTLGKLEDPVAFEAPRILERPVVVQEVKEEKPQKSFAPFTKVVAVSFHKAGKIYDFDSGEFNLLAGDQVVVETEEGLGFTTVVIATRTERTEDLGKELKKVIRKTTYDDMRQHQKNIDREKVAFQLCQQKIRDYKLDMKLVHGEYLHSGAKVLFFFSSESRVDFRQLVRDLAQELHARIEMRQIGPRDEAKIMGGIGVCGRELCCSTWLRDFDPVSIKMAKEQELSLNPSKLAGQCGRLKCCLSYEYETYVHLKHGMPKVGKKVCWKDGTSCGRVSGHNVFVGTVRVTLEDGSEKLVNPSEIQLASSFQATNNPPPVPENA